MVEDEDALALVFGLHRHVRTGGRSWQPGAVIPLYVTAGKKQTSKLHLAGSGLEVGLIGNCGEQPCVAALVSSTIHLVAWHVGMGRVFLRLKKFRRFGSVM